ncbi:iron-sulfur cluster assembly accessory protein [Acidithiobacillus sp.]|uniref:HesB/IscA family protein n=1 Tax=Acidithiobacillus sp. TaxID=1872118 RepID=UPI00258CA134|nr:iron-sulfur cluster assembly accessory protein [Acidithiobacillus sp.]MDD5374527.1 iron-sulfur cluster assembly accessory protein [Acidithiobacillus sp.]
MLMLTEKAIDVVKNLLAENPEASGLRVAVTGGGCSGYQYGMGLEAGAGAEDTVVAIEGVAVYVDNASAALLNGVIIDYVDELSGSGFRFENPNATGTCGCGSSFTTGDEASASSASSCGHRS